MDGRGDAGESDRVWTLPNVMSLGRLVGVPLFLWLIVVGQDGWALLVLAASAVTDYLDGKIARWFHQMTRLGRILDPLADRLYVLSALVGLFVRGVLPWWFVGLLIARDAVGAVLVRRIRAAGYRGFPVHFVGKAATFNLLYAFPILLLAEWRPDWQSWALPLGWAFAWWGLALYWVAVVMYGVQARELLRDPPGRRPPHRPPASS